MNSNSKFLRVILVPRFEVVWSRSRHSYDVNLEIIAKIGTIYLSRKIQDTIKSKKCLNAWLLAAINVMINDDPMYNEYHDNMENWVSTIHENLNNNLYVCTSKRKNRTDKISK